MFHCKFTNCKRFTMHTYCRRHRCTHNTWWDDECHNPIASDDSKVCETHTCRVCRKYADEGKLCHSHKCGYKLSIYHVCNVKTENGMACPIHMCVVKDCRRPRKIYDKVCIECYYKPKVAKFINLYGMSDNPPELALNMLGYSYSPSQ